MKSKPITARVLFTAADVRHLARAVESGGAALVHLRLRSTGPRTAVVTSARLGWRKLILP